MTGWLQCRLDPGMFSDEVTVSYPAASDDQWQKSVFVPRTSVRYAGEHDGEVMVKVFVKDGFTFAVLPSPWGDVVTVEGADLKRQ